MTTDIASLLFNAGEKGFWLDPSDVNLTWRRNLLTRTEEFDNSVWGKTRSTITENAATGPDGIAVNATKLVATNVSGDHFVNQFPTVSRNLVYSGTIVAKPAEYSSIWIHIIAGGAIANRGKARFNLSTGTVSNTSSEGDAAATTASIVPDGNGFYRCTLSCIPSVSNAGANVILLISLVNNSGLESFTGDNVSGVYIIYPQLEQSTAASTYQKIVTPEITYLADVQPQPVLFQDSVGSMPVTAADQPVGLILDKSQGLTLGADLVTNGTFDTDTSWTKGAGWTISGGKADKAAGTASNLQQTLVAPTGRYYKFTADITVSAGSLAMAIGNGSLTATVTASGSYIFYFNNTGSDTNLYFVAGSTFAGSVDNVTVKEIAGNHFSQSTSTNRSTLRRDTNGNNYFDFDGVDDSTRTNAIAFSSSDEISVFTALRKNDDTNKGVVVELTSDVTTNSGAFCLYAPDTNGGANYAFASRGTILTDTTVSGKIAPSADFISAIAKIGTPSNVLRVNGVQVDSDTASQGAGNFSNAEIYIGRRNNTSLPFKGRIYSLIIRDRVTSDTALSSVETYLAERVNTGHTSMLMGVGK